MNRPYRSRSRPTLMISSPHMSPRTTTTITTGNISASQVPATAEQPLRMRHVSQKSADDPRSELLQRHQKFAIQSPVERPAAAYPQLPPPPSPKAASHPRIYAKLKTVKSFIKRYTSDSGDEMSEGFDTGRGTDPSTSSELGHASTGLKIAESRALDPSPTIDCASNCKVPRPLVLTASLERTREISRSTRSEKRVELIQENRPGARRQESEPFPYMHYSRSHTPENSVRSLGHSSNPRAHSGSRMERMHTKSHHREQGKPSQMLPVVTPGPHPITRQVVPIHPPDVASYADAACSKPKSLKSQPISMFVSNPANTSEVDDTCFDHSSCAKEDLSRFSDLTGESIQINVARLLKPAIACKMVLAESSSASPEVSGGSGNESSAESSKRSSILSSFTFSGSNSDENLTPGSSVRSPGSQDDSEDVISVRQLRRVMRRLTRLLDKLDPQDDDLDPLHQVPSDQNSSQLTHSRRVKITHAEFLRIIQQELHR